MTEPVCPNCNSKEIEVDIFDSIKTITFDYHMEKGDDEL